MNNISNILESLVNEDMTSLYGKNRVNSEVESALQSLADGTIKKVPITFKNKDADMSDVLGLSGSKVQFKDKDVITIYSGFKSCKYCIKDTILMLLFSSSRWPLCSGLKQIHCVVCFEFKNNKDIKDFIQSKPSYFSLIEDLDSYVSKIYDAKYRCYYLLRNGTLLTAREWIESLQPIKNVAKFLQTEDSGIDYKKELKSVFIEEYSVSSLYKWDLEFCVVLEFKDSATAGTFFNTLMNGDKISKFLISICDALYSDKDSIDVRGKEVIFRY